MGPRRPRVRTQRTPGRAGALHGPVRAAGRAHARQHRRLPVRAGHPGAGRSARLCRRVQTQPLRLGEQGPRQKPRRRPQATARLQPGPGQPAAAGGVRPPHHPHPHPVQRPPVRNPHRAPARAGPARKTGPAAPPLDRPREFSPPKDQPRHHRSRRQKLRHPGRRPAQTRRRPRRSGPLPHPVPVLLFCRRRGPAARPHVRRPGQQPPTHQRQARHRPGQPVHRHARRRPLRQRRHPLVQRRVVQEDPGAAAHHPGHDRAAQRRRAQLVGHRRVHLRHPVRTRPRPRQTQPARRPLHRPGHHPAHHRARAEPPIAS